MNYLRYKNYVGSVEYSDDDKCLFGKVQGIRSLLMYEGESVKELQLDFEKTIDEYLAACKASNIEPEKPFKGVFNVRISSDSHLMLSELANQSGRTINAIVNDAITEYLNDHQLKQ